MSRTLRTARGLTTAAATQSAKSNNFRPIVLVEDGTTPIVPTRRPRTNPAGHGTNRVVVTKTVITGASARADSRTGREATGRTAVTVRRILNATRRYGVTKPNDRAERRSQAPSWRVSVVLAPPTPLRIAEMACGNR